jgi:tRNA nucleotidyltransferase (CCA-adding enzyme)
MKIYLVGGAVRDKLLNLSIDELDWVVVGSNPKEMIQLGYQQVGRDFPVFLHPKTKEEYALARQERKTAAGYYGFSCDFNSSISLEDDLLRRDLTINAMAMRDDGSIIDPYGGQRDLENKILRHVSAAFIEDPLRLLRVARFAARYHYLGFKIALETKKLMRDIVASGELKALVKERVWQETEKSLLTRNPEIFFCTLRECGALQQIFPELDRLFGVPATPFFHPEIDTGVHTLMVINKAAKLSSKLSVRFAAAMHDLGKGDVSQDIWPRHTKHEELGCDTITKLCLRFNVPTKLRRFAIIVSKLHVRIHKVLELSAEDIVDTMENASAFRSSDMFLDLLLVAEADSLGRGLEGDFPNIPWFFPTRSESTKQIKSLDNIQNGAMDVGYKQAKLWRMLLDNLKKIKTSDFIAEDCSGEQIKRHLRQKRIDCVKDTLEFWKKYEK